MIDGIKSISNSIATAYGMPANQMPVFTMKGGSPPLVNDAALVARLNLPFKELLGDKNVVSQFPPATGSEDVHLLMGDHKIPLDFILVGIAEPRGLCRSAE